MMRTLHKQALTEEDAAADWLSGLMDGEAGAHAREEGIRRLCRDEAARARWALYHGIGDAMRGMPALSPDFEQRFRERLAAEPTVLAPRLRRYAAPTAMPLAASLEGLAALVLQVWPFRTSFQLAGTNHPRLEYPRGLPRFRLLLALTPGR